MGRFAVAVAAGAAMLVALALAAFGVGEEAGALSDWQALTLGVVQGATELLPISSSGHLILVPWLADWTYLEQHDAYNQTFDVALHLGTLVAVLAYFWADALRLLAAWLRSVRRRRIETPDERVAWFVFVATIPAALAGALGESLIAEHLGEPWQIAIFLSLFAGVLWWADRRPQQREMSELGLVAAAGMGLAQSLALMPGVSRSGITITAGRLLGLDRDSAARFSFLLLIPTVLGAVVYKGLKDVLFGDLPAGWEGPFAVGTIAAAGSGLLAVSALLGYVRRHDYSLFVLYRLLAAAAVLLLIAGGVRAATF
ncbi:MAG TPA: undecaprenyl-diphosphate phosphatase [Gaiellaceae bacterium]|nr:undecaprenyl-diphosphate phosphatase [Gaiellaceae bacterium]